MKAVYFEQHGGTDVLKYGERPVPEISENEVMVRLKAASVNHLDIWVRQGMPAIPIALPHISGCEGSGIVESVGSSVHNVHPGDCVIVAPGIPCGRCRFCASGWDSACPEYRMVGFQADGCFAEFVKAPVTNIIPISKKFSFEEWASVPLVFLTAWHMLITRAELKPGETVLVQAAGSGIGIAAIQVARTAGARVVATAGTDEKLKKARALGAHEGINYKREDVAKRVLEITEGRGADIVFEHVGPETWESSMKSLSKLGRVVTCGATSGPKIEIDLRFLFMRQTSILGSYMGGRAELDRVLELFRLGELKPVVDKTFPLKETREAQEYMLERKNFGKIVVRI
ncbi:MAG: zinc-binding dehydrogenase [Candidatus Omnitrophica bacterium]|nr:zinc-binding dehydrogenase [Candidatus Omnitrophota bacterium]